MLTLIVTGLVMLGSGVLVWPLMRHWSATQTPARLERRAIRREVHRHPRLSAALTARLDPESLTGLALTTAAALVVVGATGFGLILWMIRSNEGFARWDASAADFAARHATPDATAVLRHFTQFGGAVYLVPIAAAVWVVAARRHGSLATGSFLVATVAGQYGLADLVKWIVDRTRPDVDRLTGFSGPSFPSGHATASAATFAAFALLAGIGRSPRVRATLASAAVAVATGIACTRVFLGVHWLTDVLAGLALGWAWFALCTIAFGGRLLRFGQPAEVARNEVAADTHDAGGGGGGGRAVA